jgi:mono/diheme cytochrome c family protein
VNPARIAVGKATAMLAAISLLPAVSVLAADPWPAAQAVLDARCISCHGEQKQKAGLRLDSLEAVLRGGQGGPVIQPGRPEASALVIRTLLAADDDDRMPPTGERLASADLAALRAWISASAPVSPATAAEAVPLPTAPLVASEVTAALVEAHVVVRVLPGGWWSVNGSHVPGGITSAILAQLAVAGPAILDLDLARSGITGAQLAAILRACPRVERLRLSECPIGDPELAAIAQSTTLTHLVLLGTQVSDAGLMALAPLTRLERLYLQNTAVSPAGRTALETILPDCQIDLGPDGLPSGAPPAKKKGRNRKP